MKVKLFGSPSPGLPLLGALTLAAALAGCGGGGTSNPATVAHVRGFNAVPDGTTALISVNNSTLPGSVTGSNGTVTNGLGFLQASPYSAEAVSTGNFLFTLTSSAAATFPAVTQALTQGTYYSAFVVGRAGITASSDARYPRLLVVTDDRTLPPTGDARLRIVQAAPDAGNVDVLINGAVAASSIAYQSVGNYLNETAGDLTVQVNKAGTNTVLVPATTITLSSGQLYTLLADEPYLTPSPAYSVQLQTDGP